jgi:hypothetical protein
MVMAKVAIADGVPWSFDAPNSTERRKNSGGDSEFELK